MRELVVDAWRMCTPAMLHDLPEMPSPGRGGLVGDGRGGVGRAAAAAAPRLCTSMTGRPPCAVAPQVLEHLRSVPTPKPPREVEVRDGQVYRWVR